MCSMDKIAYQFEKIEASEYKRCHVLLLFCMSCKMTSKIAVLFALVAATQAATLPRAGINQFFSLNNFTVGHIFNFSENHFQHLHK